MSIRLEKMAAAANPMRAAWASALMYSPSTVIRHRGHWASPPRAVPSDGSNPAPRPTGTGTTKPQRASRGSSGTTSRAATFGVLLRSSHHLSERGITSPQSGQRTVWAQT